MYGNAPTRSRGVGRFKTEEYRVWQIEAGLSLNAQHPLEFRNRVEISIDLDDRRKGDCENRNKGILDLLVAHGVILDDSKPYVKRVSIGWEPCDGCVVHIQEVAQ
jgi:Holliday junction resolvase RusA-like endonuclease